MNSGNSSNKTSPFLSTCLFVFPLSYSIANKTKGLPTGEAPPPSARFASSALRRSGSTWQVEMT